MNEKIDDAIDTLTALRDEHPDRAEALGTAIEALRTECDRFEDQVTEAEQMLGVLLGGENAPERATTWRFLRGKLTLPGEVLDEVERRLGLTDDAGGER